MPERLGAHPPGAKIGLAAEVSSGQLRVDAPVGHVLAATGFVGHGVASRRPSRTTEPKLLAVARYVGPADPEVGSSGLAIKLIATESRFLERRNQAPGEPPAQPAPQHTYGQQLRRNPTTMADFLAKRSLGRGEVIVHDGRRAFFPLRFVVGTSLWARGGDGAMSAVDWRSGQ
jgi:hypothetical protein